MTARSPLINELTVSPKTLKYGLFLLMALIMLMLMTACASVRAQGMTGDESTPQDAEQAVESTAFTLPEGFELVYEQDFATAEALRDFRVTQPGAVRFLTTEDGQGVMETQGPRDEYEPAVRSPYYIALLKDLRVGSFVLEVTVEQTSRAYNHRDVCFFYGFQDPSHFYYTHIATLGDQNAHKHFIVNGAPRTPYSDVFTEGYDWGDGPKVIRIVRDLESGLTQAFVAESTEPIIVGTDTTFGAGHVGVGTFDDSNQVRRIRLFANPEEVERVTTEVYSPPAE